MALSLLRNVSKFSGAGFLKTARLAPLKTYTTSVATQHTLATKPLAAILKNTMPLSRNMSSGGNFSPIWTAERLLALAMLGVLPAAFIMPCQALDLAMATSIAMHVHWGIEAMAIDYVRPVVFGNVIPKLAIGGVYLLSLATLGGLVYFIYTDIGIAKFVQKLWAVKGAKAQHAA